MSVENRRHGLPRIDHLRSAPAKVRFLSIEPLLERLADLDLTGIHWAILGGESGAGARPMDPDWVRIGGLCELQSLAQFVVKSRAFESMRYSYFAALRNLNPAYIDDEARLASGIAGFYVRTAPLFWAHHILLEPKAARTRRQTARQISREQLRMDVFKLEDRCQNAVCPLNGGARRKLKVAHLTPKINVLSNVIVLCPLCYDEQFPATSVIRVTAELATGPLRRRNYRVEIQTMDGPKSWSITSHSEHPLSNPRHK